MWGRCACQKIFLTFRHQLSIDVTFQMHIITKVFIIVKYSKNGKNWEKSKVKKKIKIRKMAQKEHTKILFRHVTEYG